MIERQGGCRGGATFITIEIMNYFSCTICSVIFIAFVHSAHQIFDDINCVLDNNNKIVFIKFVQKNRLVARNRTDNLI